MLPFIVRQIGSPFGVLLAALLAVQVMAPAAAAELSDFHEAVQRASDQYRLALTTLETGSQDETAVEVSRLRDIWHELLGRLKSERPAAFAEDQDYTTMLLEVDVRLVGVLLIIDMGNRDAARAGLESINDTLSRLNTQSSPAAP